MHIYIYTHRERERERCIYIYIYMLISLLSLGPVAERGEAHGVQQREEPHLSMNTDSGGLRSVPNHSSVSSRYISDRYVPAALARVSRMGLGASRLRTNGDNTNGAAAKVMNFDRLGKKYALALLGR